MVHLASADPAGARGIEALSTAAASKSLQLGETCACSPCVTQLSSWLRLSKCLQICEFLQLDSGSLREALYYRAVHAGPAADSLRQQAHVLHLLQSRPEIARTVLSAPCAARSRHKLTLSQLYHALPAVLHAPATLGFFQGAEWLFDLRSASGLRVSEHTARLLLQEPQATAAHVHMPFKLAPRVRRVGWVPYHLRLRDEPRLKLLSSIARSKHLTALTFDGKGTSCRPVAMLQRLTPLIGLRCLKVQQSDLDGCSLPALASTLTRMRLTALVLAGGLQECATASSNDTGMVTFAPALATLTALARLGLPGLQMSQAGATALGHALAGLPKLRRLDLSSTACMPYINADGHGLPECASLVALDLSGCWVRGKGGSVMQLCQTRARLRRLELDCNPSLGPQGVQQILTAPALLGLTRLSLVAAGVAACRHAMTNDWPWERLCTLTALQQLRLQSNYFSDDGARALAPHVGRLLHLCALDISFCGITVAGELWRALFALPRLKWLACAQADLMVQPFRVPVGARAREFVIVD